ncbi:MAG: hypothetical protein ABIO94_04960, partial [Opitutaceae bacterium]
GDAEGLAATLRKLAKNPEIVAKWAERTGWVGKFSRDRVLPQFEAVLASAGSDDFHLRSSNKLI